MAVLLLADLSDDEAAAVDWFMNEHMYHHRHVAQVYAMGCDTQCRTGALAEAFRQHVLVPRRAAQLATTPTTNPAAAATRAELTAEQED